MAHKSRQRYGIFGDGYVEIDDDGYATIPVIIEESGIMGPAPPAECRIRQVGMVGEDEFNRRYCALLNRYTDLPFKFTHAKIKIEDSGEEVTDDKLKEEGLEPLPDRDTTSQ